MNWPKAIYGELARTMKMTFADALQPGTNRGGWLRDYHLRRGFYFGIPVFFAGVASAFLLLKSGYFKDPTGIFLVVFPFALLSNIVWLGVAAWSRHRAGEA